MENAVDGPVTSHRRRGRRDLTTGDLNAGGPGRGQRDCTGSTVTKVILRPAIVTAPAPGHGPGRRSQRLFAEIMMYQLSWPCLS